ncbi:MAG: Glutamine-binding periplasmic protein precursor [Firmicutes bacterium ADurb.Bin467]|nr:MAG: Glutamine-binding periplasmic protein precursor [Firmicutes bacterium ADurb.Bin467]
MKRILSIVLALSMLVMAGAAAAETLTMATNAAFPPYEYYDDETDKIVGIDAEIAAAICAKLGYELEIVDVDFDSIVPGVQAGKYSFGMAGMTVTEDRLKSVDFSDSYATGIQVVIVPEDSAIASADDLFAEGANHKVGVQQGTTGDLYTTWDIEDTGKGTIERFKNGADAVLALTSGKVECVVIDNEPAKNFVAANPGLKILDTEYILENYAMCFSKNTPELTAQVNGALKELIADGTVQAIIDKYIPAEG